MIAKLATVYFKVPIGDLPGIGWAADYARRVVFLGEDEIPFEGVARMRREPAPPAAVAPPATCPECQKECSNAKALGAHRYQAHERKRSA